MTSAFDEYLSAVRELDAMRGAQADAAASRAGRAVTIGEQLDEVAAEIDEHHDDLAALATDAEHALRPKPPAPPPGSVPMPRESADPAVELAAARDGLEASRRDYRKAHYLAHRPPLLPSWRADERNGLIYGVFAFIGLIVQLMMLADVPSTGGLMNLARAVLWLVATPLAAFGIGWLSIGAVSRPRMGEEEKREKPPRNPRLGLVICFSTWLVSCWLGGANLL